MAAVPDVFPQNRIGLFFGVFELFWVFPGLVDIIIGKPMSELHGFLI